MDYQGLKRVEAALAEGLKIAHDRPEMHSYSIDPRGYEFADYVPEPEPGDQSEATSDEDLEADKPGTLVRVEFIDIFSSAGPARVLGALANKGLLAQEGPQKGPQDIELELLGIIGDYGRATFTFRDLAEKSL